MSDKGVTAVATTSQLAELIYDESLLFFGQDIKHLSLDKLNIELSKFIAASVSEHFAVFPQMTPIDNSMTIYFTAGALEDIFDYCNEHGIDMQTFMTETLQNAIYG